MIVSDCRDFFFTLSVGGVTANSTSSNCAVTAVLKSEPVQRGSIDFGESEQFVSGRSTTPVVPGRRKNAKGMVAGTTINSLDVLLEGTHSAGPTCWYCPAL